MQQPLALLTKNATIFSEHEVFVDCCHSNTVIYIFSIFFFQKSMKIMEKILVLILVFNIDKFFILSSVCNYYAYKCELKFGIKYDLLLYYLHQRF